MEARQVRVGGRNAWSDLTRILRFLGCIGCAFGDCDKVRPVE